MYQICSLARILNMVLSWACCSWTRYSAKGTGFPCTQQNNPGYQEGASLLRSDVPSLSIRSAPPFIFLCSFAPLFVTSRGSLPTYVLLRLTDWSEADPPLAPTILVGAAWYGYHEKCKDRKGKTVPLGSHPQLWSAGCLRSRSDRGMGATARRRVRSHPGRTRFITGCMLGTDYEKDRLF